MSKKTLMLGNEAIARGAYEAGIGLLAAYPGTPSTEIAQEAAKYDTVYAQWSPNEKVAVEVAAGASIAGARTMACMKHVGLNVAADPLMTLSYTGVNGGMVLVVADDPGMHSSQNEQDTRYYGRFAKIPVLEPSDAQECKDFVLAAYEISEQFDTPVIFRTSTRISHGTGIVECNDPSPIKVNPYVKDMGKYVMMPAMARGRHRFVEERSLRLAEYAETAAINKIERGSADIGIITSGISYAYAKEAFPNASFLKLGMVNPLPFAKIKEFAQSVKKLYVVEELEPIMTEQIRAQGIEFIGKEAFPMCGELSSEIIKCVINSESGLNDCLAAATAVKAGIPGRPPVLCAGCPHRAVFHLLQKHKAIVSGDIGCYTLGALEPLSAMDTTICMGASISAASGMSKVLPKEQAKKVVAVIGDSTFYHSGMTGLLDAVYNKCNFTVMILDNSTTGMTGHQHHPGTGRNLKGEAAPAVDMIDVVRALGIDSVYCVDPIELETLDEIMQECLGSDKMNVIITRRPCVLLKNAPKESFVYEVDSSACTGCFSCLRTGCPALEFKDKKAVINSQCTGCGLCTKLCKFNAIVKKEVL